MSQERQIKKILDDNESKVNSRHTERKLKCLRWVKLPWIKTV